jgi:hypothetical protein
MTFKKWGFIGLVGLLLIGATACGDDAGETSSTTAISATAGSTPPGSQEPQDTATETEPGQEQQPSGSLPWGEAADVDGLKITPIGPPAQDQGTTEPGNKMMLVEVVIENVSDEPQQYFQTAFGLEDDSSAVHYGGNYDSGAPSKPPLLTGSLQPGNEVRGFVPFQIPEDAEAKSLVTWRADGTEVRWE